MSFGGLFRERRGFRSNGEYRFIVPLLMTPITFFHLHRYTRRRCFGTETGDEFVLRHDSPPLDIPFSSLYTILAELQQTTLSMYTHGQQKQRSTRSSSTRTKFGSRRLYIFQVFLSGSLCVFLVPPIHVIIRDIQKSRLVLIVSTINPSNTQSWFSLLVYNSLSIWSVPILRLCGIALFSIAISFIIYIFDPQVSLHRRNLNQIESET